MIIFVSFMTATVCALVNWSKKFPTHVSKLVLFSRHVNSCSFSCFLPKVSLRGRNKNVIALYVIIVVTALVHLCTAILIIWTKVFITLQGNCFQVIVIWSSNRLHFVRFIKKDISLFLIKFLLQKVVYVLETWSLTTFYCLTHSFPF